MYENILGKKVNYIELHNFLCKIETGYIESILHYRVIQLYKEIESNGTTVWKEKAHDKESLTELLQEEEGELTSIELKQTKYGPEAAISFHSGNGLKVSLKSEEQFAQIYDYFIQKKS